VTPKGLRSFFCFWIRNVLTKQAKHIVTIDAKAKRGAELVADTLESTEPIVVPDQKAEGKTC